MSTARLVEAIVDVVRRAGPRLRPATVQSAAGGRATLLLDDATIGGVPYLSSYTPGVGDVVQVLQAGHQLLILGRTA